MNELDTAKELHNEIQTLINWSRFIVRFNFDPDKLRGVAEAIGTRLQELDEAEYQ